MAIIINKSAGGARRSEGRRPVQDFVLGWRLLLVMGWLFALVGLLNHVLIWYPFQMGNPQYEFGSVAGSLDSLPLPMMGLTIALAASRARGNNLSANVATVLLALLAVVVLASGVLYWTNVPLALKAVTEPLIRLGIKKSVLKVTAQALGYPAAMLAVIVIAYRGRTKHSLEERV